MYVYLCVYIYAIQRTLGVIKARPIRKQPVTSIFCMQLKDVHDFHWSI